MIGPLPSVSATAAGASPVADVRGPVAAAPAVSGDFASVLATVSTDAIGNLRSAEAAAISGIQGKDSVQRVVAAIMSAEETLQTAIAVRDKVVSAYQEISRMAI